MIFLDSNIPMYLVGGDHPLKTRARQLLEPELVAGATLVTSAEVFQEILHRYVAIDRRDAIAPAFELLQAIADEVFPIDTEDVERARDLVETTARLTARDALHLAVMQRRHVPRILTFDRHFDDLPGIARLA